MPLPIFYQSLPLIIGESTSVVAVKITDSAHPASGECCVAARNVIGTALCEAPGRLGQLVNKDYCCSVLVGHG